MNLQNEKIVEIDLGFKRTLFSETIFGRKKNPKKLATKTFRARKDSN